MGPGAMNMIGNDNPVLASLAEISSAALVGASVGGLIDMLRRRQTATVSTAGAMVGAVVGALVQLRRFKRGRLAR